MPAINILSKKYQLWRRLRAEYMWENEGKAARARLPIKELIFVVLFYFRTLNQPLYFYDIRELSKKIYDNGAKNTCPSLCLPLGHSVSYTTTERH